MRWIIYAFRTLGFTFQYTIPFVIFGAVIPYYHGNLAESLTTFGKLAILIFVLICVKKMKEKIIALKDSIPKSVAIALIECIPVFVVWCVLDGIQKFSVSLFKYWVNIIPYFTIGALFKLTAGILTAKEKENE